MKTSRDRRNLASCLLALSVVLLLTLGVGSSSALGNGYTSVVFSDGFESGSLSNWNGLLGNGSATVVASAAHTGTSGLHVSNAAGQFQVLVKAFPTPMIDTSVSFWARVATGGGVETIAQTRDDSTSQHMWDLAYDGTRQGLIFIPDPTGGSTEIFTGLNTAPADTWFKVEVQYTATATGGGAQLYLNDQTQAGWGVTGDYTRSANLQRLQLWNDGPNAVDFDDVSLAVPPGAASVPGAPTGLTGTAGNGSVNLSWTAPASDGGSAITGYRITPSIGGTAQTPILTGSTATSRTVTGLTNGTTYTFTVAAINAAGTGPDSAVSAALTPSAGTTVPGAPTNVRGYPGQQVDHRLVDRPSRRRQPDHRLSSHSVHRRHCPNPDFHGFDSNDLHGQQPEQRDGVHVRGCGDERARHRGELGSVGACDPGSRIWRGCLRRRLRVRLAQRMERNAGERYGRGPGRCSALGQLRIADDECDRPVPGRREGTALAARRLVQLFLGPAGRRLGHRGARAGTRRVE